MSAGRTPIMAGNWKMNTELPEAISLASAVAEGTQGVEGVEIVVCPPYPFLLSVNKVLGDSHVQLGAQNCYFVDSGAYTGSVSASMVKQCGTSFVICGHSERRAVRYSQGLSSMADDDIVNRKVLKVLETAMKPILCVGETIEEFNSGTSKQVVKDHLVADLKNVSPFDMPKLVVAYEPIWAIGTGMTASPEIAQDMHAFIRNTITDLYSKEIADQVRIQYGGSVTPDTVDQLMACPDIDGALVGGASLDPAKFCRIALFNKVAEAAV